MGEKKVENGNMSLAFGEASELIKAVAADPGLSVKGRIAKAARMIGVSFNRAKDIWYGNAARIEAYEMDTLRAVAKQQQADERARHVGAEYRELRDRIAYLEARIAAISENASH